MKSARPSGPPRSARERVAQRRAARRLSSRPRSRRGCNGLVVALLVLLALLGALVLLFTSQARETLQAVEQQDPRQQAPGVAATTDGVVSFDTPFTVLLIGVDRRSDPEEGVRGDTLIVVHVDPPDKRASMLSIPRDSVVDIPHLGMQKINTAYTFGYANVAELYGDGTEPAAGGGALAAETVEGFLGVKIDYIAQVDFNGFERIVDTLGGVLVDVPQPLLDAEYPTEDYGVERIYVPAGLQVLDGRTALRYARSRHSGSDFDRSRRQQQVLRAILDEVRRRGMLDQASLLPELVRDVQESVQTTLPLSDLSVLRGMAALARDLDPGSITQLSINPNDVTLLSENGSDLYWDPGEVKLLARRLIAGPDSTVEIARVQVQNGTSVGGLAGRVSGQLERQGFLIVPPADAPGNFEHSLLIDYTNKPETRQQLAEQLGIDPQYILTGNGADLPPASGAADIVLIVGDDYQERWASDE